MEHPIQLKDIQSAQKSIEASIRKTQMSYSRNCSEWLGTEIFLKRENEQRTGSFKIRGALNKMLSLTDEELSSGVVASSAGNHAQGVAYAAHCADAKSFIVMPNHSPLVKIEGTKAYGAEVILHGEYYDESYAYAKHLEQEKGLKFIHPYEDPCVIAGQGTIGLEMLEQLPDVDSVIVSIGGGGLISGIATAIKAIKPQCKVYGAVTREFPGMKWLYKGEESGEFGLQSIADGIAVKKPSFLMHEYYIAPLVDDIVAVDEDAIAYAIVFLLERAKTVVEGAGAIALAAAAQAKWDLGKKCCVLLSGGNIDLNLVSKVIDRGLSQTGRLTRFKLITTDRPGVMQGLTRVIAEKGANILEVQHERLAPNLGMRQTEIYFLLETKDSEHVREIKTALGQLESVIEVDS